MAATTSTNNLRVHISPVGFDPADRVAGPLLQLRADKVYLISKGKDDLASSKMTEVKRILEAHPYIELHDVHVDIFDLFCCLEKFREIFQKEKGNHIHVNVSTGSKILSIAGMLACMLWKGAPYYAKLDYENERKQGTTINLIDVRKVKETEFLPVYQINMPSEQSLKVLGIIATRPGERISKKELIEELQELKTIPSFQASQPRNAPHSRLRAILDPLEKHWQFVKVEARGRRSEVSLTQQGKSALRIFGTGSEK